MRYYSVNLTPASRGSNTIPQGMLVWILSNREDISVVSWRSRDNDNNGNNEGIPGTKHPHGPCLIADFVYDLDTNHAMARPTDSTTK
jgi:hypothetical protein